MWFVSYQFFFRFLGEPPVGGGGGGGGAAGRILRGNFGTGERASISKLTPFIYLAFEKRTHSYT